MDNILLTRHGHETVLEPAEYKNRGSKAGRPEKWEGTQKGLLKLPRPTTGNRLFFDIGVHKEPGFAVRITCAGKISYVLNYRFNGRERRYTIGKGTALTVAVARKKAHALRDLINNGIDPFVARESEREAQTMTDLGRKYFEAYANTNKRASSLRNDRQMLDNVILPRLGRLRVIAVAHRDIESLHSSLIATPYRANRILSLLSKMFSLAVEWHADNAVWRTDNPAAHVKKFHEDKRERWLRKDELDRLTSALATYPYQDAANAIRLLLLTGARKSEVLSATWTQIDLEQAMWTKPSAHTKQKKTEHVPLGKEALRLLVGMKATSTNEFLFPGRTEGNHLKDLKNDWREICRTAKLDAVRIHDLRHTYASHLVSDGVPLAIVGKLLGHTQAKTTERYAHIAESPLREATNRFAELLSAKPKKSTRERK